LKLPAKFAWLFTQWSRRDLSARAKIVLFALSERSDQNLTCFPSIARVAKDCGISRQTVVLALKELVGARLIERRQRRTKSGDLDSTFYTLIIPEAGRVAADPRSDTRVLDVGAHGAPTGRIHGYPENPPNINSPIELVPAVSLRSVAGEGTCPPVRRWNGNTNSPTKMLFDQGVSILAATGANERAARSFMGRLRKFHGDQGALRLLEQAEGKTAPIEWLAATLRDPSTLPYVPMGRK
jgi:hypothetical protein